MVKNQFSTDDRLVWLRLKEGDADAVDALMKKYYHDLYNYGMKLSKNQSLTKDCIQDLFVKLWHDRAKLSEVTFVKTYLLVSLKRSIIKVLNKENRLTDFGEESTFETEIVFSQEDILIHQQELVSQHERLVAALNKLPNRNREAIYLKFYSELNNEQIAEVMGLKTQSVYNLIHEALKILKDKILKALVVCVLWYVIG